VNVTNNAAPLRAREDKMADIFLDLHNCRVCRQFWDGDVEGADHKLVVVMREHCKLAHPNNAEIPVSVTNGRCVRNILREDVPE
jgi:hypothetical protein